MKAEQAKELQKNLDEEECGFESNEVCCCGPSYDKETILRNQLLRVPRLTTDQPSILVLAVFVVFMVVIWFYSVAKGQYLLLINGMDWRGQACGSGDLATYTHQAWVNPLMSSISAGAICVASCPAPANNAELNKDEVTCLCNPSYWPEKFGTGSGRSLDLINGCEATEAQILGYFKKVVNPGDALLEETKTGTSGSPDQPCAFTYRTQWAMHKCVPWVSSTSLSQVVTQQGTVQQSDHVKEFLAGATEIFTTFMTDVADCVTVAGVCMGFAVVLSLVALMLLRYCVNLVAKGALLALFVLVIFTAVASYLQYESFRERVDTVPQLSTHDADTHSMHVYLGIFIVTCVVGFVYTACTVFMWENLECAVSIIKVASESFTDAPQLLLYPLVHMVSFVALISFWLMGAILLYSSGDVHTDDKGVAYMVHTPFVRSAAVFYLFGLFWFSAFMNAMGYMIVAGTVYLCTFAMPKEPTVRDPNPEGRDIPDDVMSAAGFIMIRYHMGTAALGSLILTLVWPVRFVVNAFHEMGNSNQSCMKFVCCCCQCCVWTWDKHLKYLNKLAFLQTVLHGYSFCGAAFEGLGCVFKGIAIIGPTTYIASFVLIVLKITIALTMTACADLMIQSGHFGVTSSDLTFSWVPYLLVAFASYVIATAFVLLLEVAIDAVMVAYCEAHFESRGGAITPSQLPASLMAHIDNFGGEEQSEARPLMSAESKSETPA